MKGHLPQSEDHCTKYLDILRECISVEKTSTIIQRIQESQNLSQCSLAGFIPNVDAA